MTWEAWVFLSLACAGVVLAAAYAAVLGAALDRERRLTNMLRNSLLKDVDELAARRRKKAAK